MRSTRSSSYSHPRYRHGRVHMLTQPVRAKGGIWQLVDDHSALMSHPAEPEPASIFFQMPGFAMTSVYTTRISIAAASTP